MSTLAAGEVKGVGEKEEGGQLIGDTKCENVPRRVCIPNNCGMVESKEEECHNKKSLVLQEIPEEVGFDIY